MATSVHELRLLLDDFVGGAPYLAFWNAFVEHAEDFAPEAELSPAGQLEYRALYDLVYESGADPISPAQRAEGIVGEAELRDRLRAVRLETSGGTSGRAPG